MFSSHEIKKIMAFTVKEYFFLILFYCFIYTSMRASDIITNIAKQNMNMLSAGETKTKKVSANQNDLVTKCSLPSYL